MLVAVLALGAGSVDSAALAQAGYPGPGYGTPYRYARQRTVPYDRFGHFSCGYNERHTRLERRACGGIHYRY